MKKKYHLAALALGAATSLLQLLHSLLQQRQPQPHLLSLLGVQALEQQRYGGVVAGLVLAVTC